MTFPKVNNEAIAFEKETKNKLKLSLLFSEHASVENVGVHTALFKGPTLRSRHSSHPASLTVPSAPCHGRLSPTLHSYPLKSQLDPFVPSHFPGYVFIHFQVLGLVRMSPLLPESPTPIHIRLLSLGPGCVSSVFITQALQSSESPGTQA